MVQSMRERERKLCSASTALDVVSPQRVRRGHGPFPVEPPDFPPAVVGRAKVLGTAPLVLLDLQTRKTYGTLAGADYKDAQFDGVVVQCREVKKAADGTGHGGGDGAGWVDAGGPQLALKITKKALVLRRAADQGRKPGAMYGEDPCKELAVLQLLKAAGGHPHVEELVAALHDNDFIYKLSKFCDGGEAFAAVPMPEPDAQRLTRQLLSAVAFCHAHGVMHRDISLENCLLETRPDGKSSIRLIDFGMAIAIPRDAFGRPLPLAPQGRCGKSSCMAPEVHLDAPFDAAAADLWSCAAVTYMCLLGVAPWRTVGDELFRVVSVDGRLAALLQHWGINGRASPAAVDLLQRMLSADPRRRLLTLHDVLAHPWIAAPAAARVLPTAVPTATLGAAAAGSGAAAAHVLQQCDDGGTSDVIDALARSRRTDLDAVGCNQDVEDRAEASDDTEMWESD